MRYENPLYMAEDAGAADLIAGGRLQLGISRGSPEQVIDGWRYFGYAPAEGETDADMARRHAEVFLELLEGEGFAQPNPRPMFPNPPGLLRLEPHSEGLRDRIWWGAASDATAVWAAKLGMNLQSSTLKFDETGEPFHVQQAEADPRLPRGLEGSRPHPRAARFGQPQHLRARRRPATARISAAPARARTRSATSTRTPARSSAAATPPSPTCWSKQLREDEAIAEADTLLLTVPNQLGVDYNAHVHRGDPEARGAGAWAGGEARMTSATKPTIAVPLAGEMGAAIGGVLVRHGLRVLTRTAGRSERTRERARTNGLEDADHDGLAAADMVLWIVPWTWRCRPRRRWRRSSDARRRRRFMSTATP